MHLLYLFVLLSCQDTVRRRLVVFLQASGQRLPVVMDAVTKLIAGFRLFTVLALLPAIF